MNNDYKRILTIQDISCVGQCSLTVALPILSACGLETAILPSAVLSTHTGGFTGFTFRDLTDDMPAISAHWKKENLSFKAVCTGYLGSIKQIQFVQDIFKTNLEEGGITIVDPAMADNGKLYSIFDQAYVDAMKPLCFSADIILPNITEAAYITDAEYRENYDEAYIKDLLSKLAERGAKRVILTGVSYRKETTGVVVYDNGDIKYYEHERFEKGSHGTGDVYASAFVGAFMSGKSLYDAAVIAADYTLSCIRVTQGDPDHTYGVKFETVIPELIDALRKE